MAGNAWEWVDDKFSESGESRVLRGGSWRDNRRNLRAASCGVNHPDDRSLNIGFRECRGAPIEKRATGALDAGPPAR